MRRTEVFFCGAAFCWVGISVALWHMQQVGCLPECRHTGIISLGLHGSIDLDISVHDGFLDKGWGYRSLYHTEKGEQDQVQGKSNRKLRKE